MRRSNRVPQEGRVASQLRSAKPSSKLLLIAETNFLVGYALEQGSDFQSIIDFVSANRAMTLAIPEFGFKEARSALDLNLVQTRHALEKTRGMLRQVGRSEYIQEAVRTARTALTEVINQLETRAGRIDQILEDLSQHCLMIPYTPEAMARARLRYLAGEPPCIQTDCELYESILEYARSQIETYEYVILLTLDQEHFDHDEIRDELADLGIDLVFSGGECIAMARYALGMTS